MLFDPAMLSTSVAISHVAEAFGMPEISFQVTISGSLADTAKRTPFSSIVSPADIPAALFVDPAQAVSDTVLAVEPAQLANLSGLGLLQSLAVMPESAIADYVAGNSEALNALLTAQPATATVSDWWATLGVTSRSAMLLGAPGVVGNLEGVPFGVRDTANRRYLTTSREATAGAEGSGGRAERVDADAHARMLDQIAEAIVSPPGAPTRYLLSLDPTGSGTAAIVIGDLSAADYVTFMVPGMFYSVDAQMVAWTAAAQGIYDTEAEWISRLGETDPSLAAATTATVAWIGYETPGMTNFTSLELAYEGRDAIARSINGLRELRDGDEPFLSVIAHSYGSTATMLALTDYGITVDALALIGSPGSSAQSVADLGVRNDAVYVGEAEWDQIKDSAFFGSDPGSASFGARLFSVNGGDDPITSQPLVGSTGHDAYLVPGSESVRNLALICLGQGRLVTTDDGSATAAKATSALR